MSKTSFLIRVYQLGLMGIFLLGIVPGNQAQDVLPTQPKLLVFSGSDWCLPCIRFDREILQDSVFKSFSRSYLPIEILDFPQHNQLPPEQVKYNEQMAEKYNPQGYFPHILLVDESSNLKVQIKTNKVTAADVIAQIKPYLKAPTQKEFSASLVLMGSAFNITLVADAHSGEAYLKECIATIQEIESWLSAWQEGSITSKLNNNAAQAPVTVTENYYQLLTRALRLSELTQGAFDISFNGLHKLYQFDQKEHELPPMSLINEQLTHVGYENIQLMPENQVFFTDSLLSISFGAIGKGYAADVVQQLMQAKGVRGGVINASGDLTTWGTRSNGDPWRVGIPDPLNQNEIIMWLPLIDKAIATSGDAEKYFLHNGRHYSHIINPKTGLPVVGSRSVSVISSSGELADALATAVSVLGVEIGLDLINQIADVECIFIDKNSKLHFSNGLQPNE